MFGIVVGPIDYWWSENWHTDEHWTYWRHRQHVCKALVEAGHLVFQPHAAFKGAWDERLQVVNDTAIDMAEFMVNVRPPGIPAHGTAAEVKRFIAPPGVPGRLLFDVPPGPFPPEFGEFAKPLEDPYETVVSRTH